MAGGANPAPAATDLVPVAIYLPNKFGPGVGGYTTYQIEIENLSSLGPVGPPGPPGPGGPTGTQGPAGPGYKATSTSAIIPGTGIATFVTQSGLAYLTGERVRAASAGTTNTFVEGPCQSYNPNANPPTIVINADTFGGTGSHSDWNIGVGGTPGPQGPQGLPGTAGGAGGTNGQFQYNSSGNFGGVTLTGDITGVNLSNGVVTVNWANHPVFVASGASHAKGAVPDPGATAGTTRFLCENATWAAVPPSIPDAPVDGTLYGRVSATWVQGVKLAGDTMTGQLNISPPTGSANVVLSPVTGSNSSQIILNKPTGVVGAVCSIVGQTGNANRWIISLNGGAAESGGPTGVTGSDFSITRYNNSGGGIDSPLSIGRSNGAVTFGSGTLVAQNLTQQTATVISNATWAANQITYTLAASVGMAAGGSVTITGANPSGYNGTYTTLAGSGGTNFIVTQSTNPGAYVANSGTLTFNGGTSSIFLHKAAGGFNSSIYGTVAGSTRWTATLGDSVPESGSAAGSNFSIQNYDDTGNPRTYVPFAIRRSDGFTTFGVNTVSVSPVSGGAQLNINKAASGQVNALYGQTATANRWLCQLGDNISESGSSAGSNFALQSYSDAAVVNTPLYIRRSDDAIALGILLGNPIAAGGAFDQSGYQVNMRTSTASEAGISFKSMSAGTAVYNCGFYNNANSLMGSITTTDTATAYATTSDRRLKEDIESFSRGRELVDQLQVRSFTWKTNHLSDVGLIAQEAVNTFPQAVNIGSGEPGEDGFRPWGVDYAKYVPLLIQALQDAHKRIDELEQRIEELET
jgi:hypothetical protein